MGCPNLNAPPPPVAHVQVGHERCGKKNFREFGINREVFVNRRPEKGPP